MSKILKAAVLTHNRPEEVVPSLNLLKAQADKYGVELFYEDPRLLNDATDIDRHGPMTANVPSDCDICLTLGGDGTILRGLRTFAGTATPTFAINFGEIGFLATVEREDIEHGLELAFTGNFDVLELPAIGLELNGSSLAAFNDISIHRQAGARVASLAYSVEQQEIGQVRCDGLVVSTPAGSTGYNLANGGPVLAWGVEGYVVSFIAPHSLTARSLVVAPNDPLTLQNSSRFDAVDISVDGRPSAVLNCGESIELKFIAGHGKLAQLPNSTFYKRIRERFGRLSA